MKSSATDRIRQKLDRHQAESEVTISVENLAALFAAEEAPPAAPATESEPEEPLSPDLTALSEALQEAEAAIPAAVEPEVPKPEPASAASKPWMGIAIGAGIAMCALVFFLTRGPGERPLPTPVPAAAPVEVAQSAPGPAVAEPVPPPVLAAPVPVPAKAAETRTVMQAVPPPGAKPEAKPESRAFVAPARTTAIVPASVQLTEPPPSFALPTSSLPPSDLAQAAIPSLPQPAPQPPAPANVEAQKPQPVTATAVAQSVAPLKMVQPVYPPMARTARIQGTVLCAATVGLDGSVTKVQPLSGPPMLYPAAAAAVRQWKYRPFLSNGQPVETAIQVKVNFSLDQTGFNN